MTSSPSFRWGIIGPGRIANKFAASLPFTKNGILTSVASRDPSRAEEFAKKYGAEFHFSSYEEMILSKKIDAVYIATPHSFHREGAALALSHGIPVLCEKPLTESVEDSLFLVEKSRQTKTFLMEGMWTVFLPHFQKAQEWILENKIGEVIHVQADFGYLAPLNFSDRLYNPELGGSVTKDVGIYPLSLFHKILGSVKSIQSLGNRAETGVDSHVIFQGKSERESTFQGMVSFLSQTNVEAAIFGKKGKITINSQWLRPVAVNLTTETETIIFNPEVPAFGFQFEADEVERCVNKGMIGSDVWSHNDSLVVADLISKVEKV
jgi:predicted dehydrogenase